MERIDITLAGRWYHDMPKDEVSDCPICGHQPRVLVSAQGQVRVGCAAADDHVLLTRPSYHQIEIGILMDEWQLVASRVKTRESVPVPASTPEVPAVPNSTGAKVIDLLDALKNSMEKNKEQP